MTLTGPILLLGLLPLLAYTIWLGQPRSQHRRRRAWFAVLLRCVIISLIIFGLAGLERVQGTDRLSVIFLLDVSDSMSQPELERALEFISAGLASLESNDRAAVITFGADALVDRPLSADTQLADLASVPLTHLTNMEEAIRLGLALPIEGDARRMVLLSDGRPTAGNVDSVLSLVDASGAQLDTVILDTPIEAEVWVADLDGPTRVHPGEEFALSVTIHSTVQTETALTMMSGGRIVAQLAAHLGPGPNRFTIPLTAGDPGFISYRAVIVPELDSYPQNNSLSTFTIVEGPPRILVVGDDVVDTLPVQQALDASGLIVEVINAGALPSEPVALAQYGGVVLVNTPAQSLSGRAMQALQSFVRDLGGGLVAIGGPSSYGVGGWYNTPLEATLPVRMTIRDPERFPPMSIVVIIDKSGSMAAQEGGVQKIRLAGEAAARVAELINDLDEMTIIAFDDRPADIIGPLPGSRRDELADRAISLQAGGGGIYVRESLQTALAQLADSESPVKHIILLADGSDSEHQSGVAQLVEEEIAGQRITLSTVAIGAGQDLEFLEIIARLGNGRYHFTDRAANLPVIFAQEAQLAMRAYIVEEPFFPTLASSSPVLTGLDSTPQLIGYVAASPKPTAQVVLITHKEDPLLATWQYGLGRAVAWTSDATGRWAQRWVDWEGFARFWTQVVRWTLPQQSETPVELSVSLEGDSANLVLDAVTDDGEFINGLTPSVTIVDSQGVSTTVGLNQVAPGQYTGLFEPGGEGAYVLRLVSSATEEQEEEDYLALTSGWVLGYSPEYAALDGDPGLMNHLANLGGGRVLEDPAEAFAHTFQGHGTRYPLWPILLTTATLLLPIDIGVRRLVLGRRELEQAKAWVQKRIPRRAPASDTAEPSPISQLLEAKERVQQPSRDVIPHPPAKPMAEREPPQPTMETREPDIPQREEATEVEETLAERLLRKKKEREND
jgi:uncharacterized membrane protein